MCTSVSDGVEPTQWDVFLAYAGPDRNEARALYDELARCGLNVFWDERERTYSRRFGPQLLNAQRSASMTVALIHGATIKQAYYLNEEIAIAIDCERDPRRRHGLFVVNRDATVDPTTNVYGLLSRSAFQASDDDGLRRAAEQITKELRANRHFPHQPGLREVASPKFRRLGYEDCPEVNVVLNRLFASQSEARELVAELISSGPHPSLGRLGPSRWDAVLKQQLQRNPLGLDPLLRAAWNRRCNSEAFEPLIKKDP